MGKSWFSMGFGGNPFLGQRPAAPGLLVGPLTVTETQEEIEKGGFKALRDLKFPPGFTGSYPYVVKIGGNTGEYMVYADGTAQFTDYGSGHVTAPFPIK